MSKHTNDFDFKFILVNQLIAFIMLSIMITNGLGMTNIIGSTELKKCKYNLVLMNMQMSVMGGL
jgi:hypothetical protein